MRPHVDQLARDALDDHDLVDSEPAGDEETAPEPQVLAHLAEADPNYPLSSEQGVQR